MWTCFFFLTIPPPPRSTLFPYTTLFRSGEQNGQVYKITVGRDDLKLKEMGAPINSRMRSEEHTSELQSPYDLVCRLLLEKKNVHDSGGAASEALPVAKRQRLAVVPIELLGEAVGRDPPVKLPNIIGTGQKRGFVARGRSEDRGIQIHRFTPGVVRLESCPAADALGQRDIQRMVVRGTLIEPHRATAYVGVRARRGRMVQRALRHQDPLTDGDRVAIRAGAAADASRRILAHDRIGRIGIQSERRVVGLTPHIAHRKHDVSRDSTFDRQAPLLAGGCAQDRIETAGPIDPAGWRCRRPGSAARGWKRGVLLNRRNESE